MVLALRVAATVLTLCNAMVPRGPQANATGLRFRVERGDWTPLVAFGSCAELDVPVGLGGSEGV